MRSLREKLSILLAKKPGKAVLMLILLMNIILVIFSATVLSTTPLTETKTMGFWQAAYYTLTMMFDAGCIETVIEQAGDFRTGLSIFCIVITILGMVLFTGAVIGYITNVISKFIDRADDGSRKLFISDHTVILGWNSRASEIVNEMLYLDTPQKIVILVSEGKDKIEKELDERLQNTIDAENACVQRDSAAFPLFKRRWYRVRHKFKNTLTVIVREGDTFSTKQLNDISIKQAKTVIILGGDTYTADACKYDIEKRKDELERGNPQTIKTLVQVAELTGSDDSADRQKVVIEVEDDWTLQLVNKIIEHKMVAGKCNITPVSVNKVLGQILSQISIMPELNLAYRELFSNKGITFYCRPQQAATEQEFFERSLATNDRIMPLAVMEDKTNRGKQTGTKTGFEYYAASAEGEIDHVTKVPSSDYRVRINPNYWIEQKNVVILGHNSKIKDIMAGFNSFCNEWNNEAGDILNIVVIDDKKHLEKMDYYRDYPSVIKTVESEIYDREVICSEIEAFVNSHTTDTSILILSDDAEPRDRIDSNAITYLLYVRDIMQKKHAEDPNFRDDSIDVVVEILNPKHYDVVQSYSVSNIVISNRYISKMATQIGEKEEIFRFFEDILSYDETGAATYESKEIYIKKVCRYFERVPEECTAAEFIRAVYRATSDPAPDGNHDNAIALGYVDENGEIHFFIGDQNQKLRLNENCKVILFSNH